MSIEQRASDIRRNVEEVMALGGTAATTVAAIAEKGQTDPHAIELLNSLKYSGLTVALIGVVGFIAETIVSRHIGNREIDVAETTDSIQAFLKSQDTLTPR